MVAFCAKDKGERYAQQSCDAFGWQTLGFGLVKIDDKGDGCAGAGRRLQQTDAARLDHTRELWRAAGDKHLVLQADPGLIISDEFGTIGDQLQRQRGFSAPRCTQNQHAAPVYRHATGV